MLRRTESEQRRRVEAQRQQREELDEQRRLKQQRLVVCLGAAHELTAVAAGLVLSELGSGLEPEQLAGLGIGLSDCMRRTILLK